MPLYGSYQFVYIGQPSDFEKLWDLDSIAIREKDTVLEAFEKNVNFQDGRCSVHLPWKEHHKLLPDNYENSVARLSSH